MNVICEAPGYNVSNYGKDYIISNEIYSTNILMLMIASAFEMFLPDSTTYKAPVSIIIHNDGSECNVTVDRKLHIIGTDDYEYVISNSQLSKWYKSYFVAGVVTVALVFILLSFITFAVIPNSHNPIAIVCMLIVLCVFATSAIDLVKQLRLVNKLRRIE